MQCEESNLEDCLLEKEELQVGIQTQEEFNKQQTKEKNEIKYSELAKQIPFLKKFDWLDTTNSLIKLLPINFLTPMSFWFMICTEYFPRSFMVNSNPLKSLEEILAKISNQPIHQRVRVNCSITSATEIKTDSIEDKTLNELIIKITQAFKTEKYQSFSINSNSIKETKEEYSFEDDLYIMKIRNELLEQYFQQFGTELLLSLQSTAQSSYQYSESTMAEEDSRQLLISEQDDSDSKRSSIGKSEMLEIKSEKTEYEEGEDGEKKRERNYDQLLLNSLKKIDLEDIISMYSFNLMEQEKQTEKQVNQLKVKIEKDLKLENIIYKPGEIQLDDVLVDIHQYCPLEKEYLNFLENKYQFQFANYPSSLEDADIFENNQGGISQINQQGENKSKKQQNGKAGDNTTMEDIKCQICNDGDYTDDDLIVICAKCNISVHQRCYGIPKVPIDDWICEVCLTYGPDGKYLRCALCPQRGGALKPSLIPITSLIFQNINQSYHEFQKECCATLPSPPPSNKKQKYEEGSVPRSYSNFQALKKEEFTSEDLLNEPKPFNAWCHITCALWTPECFFDDKDYYSNVKGIEKIAKQRFKLDCSICKQKKVGSCIQCAKSKCLEAFHPECARRANAFMEIKNSDKVAYLIYCERHTPLKLRRVLDHKEKKYKEEILKFCKCIERSREIITKEKSHEKSSKGGSHKKKGAYIPLTVEEKRDEEVELMAALSKQQISYISKLQKNQATKKEQCIPSCSKFNKCQNMIFKNKQDPFWQQEVKFRHMTSNQIYIRYKLLLSNPEKKKEFKEYYITTLTSFQKAKAIASQEKEQKEKIEQQKKQKKLQKLEKKQKKKNKKQSKLLSQSQKQHQDQKHEIKAAKAKDSNEIDDEEIIVIDSQSLIEEYQCIKEQTLLNEQDQDQFPIVSQNEVCDSECIIAHNYEPVDETSEKVYCICKKKYKEGDEMMACEKCDEWYHFDCIGFIGSMNDADTIQFVCKFCDQKEKSNKARAERKKKYGHLFYPCNTPYYIEFYKNQIPQPLPKETKKEKSVNKIKANEEWIHIIKKESQLIIKEEDQSSIEPQIIIKEEEANLDIEEENQLKIFQNDEIRLEIKEEMQIIPSKANTKKQKRKNDYSKIEIDQPRKLLKKTRASYALELQLQSIQNKQKTEEEGREKQKKKEIENQVSNRENFELESILIEKEESIEEEKQIIPQNILIEREAENNQENQILVNQPITSNEDLNQIADFIDDSSTKEQNKANDEKDAIQSKDNNSEEKQEEIVCNFFNIDSFKFQKKQKTLLQFFQKK